MRLEILTIFLLLFTPPALRSETAFQPQFIVWNVGQGLWTTWVQAEECWHFDMGGEYKEIISRVDKVCGQKLNRIFLSHWDFDHIGFLKPVRGKNWKICLAQTPGGEPSENKRGLIRGLPSCDPAEGVKVLWDVERGDPKLKTNCKNRSNNHDSHVFEISKPLVLIPGDSTIDEEKLWSSRLSPRIQGLVLGHHGSYTSTSDELLRRLPNLRWAVASQRFERYGHPHRKIVSRLRARKIPLLRTEDWGSLHFF
jgi:competence protein ComEC